MSFVSKEKIRPATWEVTAAIDAETFTAKVDEIFTKQMPNLSIPGFRKGKVPRTMLEKRYGENLFFEDALDALLPATIDGAVKEAELELALRPQDLDVKEIGKENGVTLTFVAIVKPEVTVQGWKGVEVPFTSPDVADEDVEEHIHQLQHRNARTVEVEDRPAQEGDVAQIDYEGFADGVPFPGGRAENFDLTLGSGSFIPGFEEQVVGHTPGDAFDIEVTFPAEYHSEDLAGKAVVFRIKLHSLKKEELPPVDDDFAQEVGEDYNTVEDLRTGVKAELTASREKESGDGFTVALQGKLAALAEGEIAEELVAKRTERNIELFAERIRIPVEQYLQYVGLDNETFQADMHARAEEQIKVELALEDIAKQEGLEATAEEIEAEYVRIAEEYNVELARAKFGVPEEEITAGIVREKALELAKAAAVKIDPPAAEEDAEENTEEETAE
ncbi:MAG: trigger factor [Oscillospiraceae bacterium]|nr:trigger factor [Oscillospiraceae bacterium]